MIDNPANCCGCTYIVNKTWIQTLVLNAGFGGITVSVDQTFHLLTEFVGVADKAWRTGTPSRVI